jgi:hypothetical protein
MDTTKHDGQNEAGADDSHGTLLCLINCYSDLSLLCGTPNRECIQNVYVVAVDILSIPMLSRAGGKLNTWYLADMTGKKWRS